MERRHCAHECRRPIGWKPGKPNGKTNLRLMFSRSARTSRARGRRSTARLPQNRGTVGHPAQSSTAVGRHVPGLSRGPVPYLDSGTLPSAVVLISPAGSPDCRVRGQSNASETESQASVVCQRLFDATTLVTEEGFRRRLPEASGRRSTLWPAAASPAAAPGGLGVPCPPPAARRLATLWRRRNRDAKPATLMRSPKRCQQGRRR